MTKEDIAVALERAATWPAEAQLKLRQATLEIEQERGIYRLSDTERADLHEAEGEFDRGEVATPSQVTETFARFRDK